MSAMDEPIVFSRNGESLGAKCTHEIKVPVTESMHNDVLIVSRLLGKSKAEWVRSLIDRELNGALEIMKRKLNGNAVSSEGHESGL